MIGIISEIHISKMYKYLRHFEYPNKNSHYNKENESTDNDITNSEIKDFYTYIYKCH